MPLINAFDVSSLRHSAFQAWTQIAHTFRKRESRASTAPHLTLRNLRSNFAEDPESKRARVTTRHIHALFSLSAFSGKGKIAEETKIRKIGPPTIRKLQRSRPGLSYKHPISRVQTQTTYGKSQNTPSWKPRVKYR
jgi:hypothetical protein